VNGVGPDSASISSGFASLGVIGSVIPVSVSRCSAFSVASRRWNLRAGFSSAAFTLCQP